MAKEKAYIHKWLGQHSRDDISIKFPRITWNPTEGKLTATQTRIQKQIERQVRKRKAFWLCTSGFRSKILSMKFSLLMGVDGFFIVMVIHMVEVIHIW